MPALKSAREKGRAVSCMNNLKQIGVALFLFANENEDAICPYRIPYYPMGLAPYLPIPPMPSNPPVAGMPEYLVRPNPWLCPSVNYGFYLSQPGSFWDSSGQGSSSSYGCNLESSDGTYGLFADTTQTGRDRVRRLGGIRAPEEVWLFADSKLQFLSGAFHSRYYLSALDTEADLRHSGRAHFLFADGHVGARVGPFPKDSLRDQAFYRFYNGTDGPY